MNATALQLSVSNLIDSFGNTMVYYIPKEGTTYFNDEGDWTPTYQTTSTSTKWIESSNIQSHDHTELGMFPIKDGTMLVKGTIDIGLRGKCISNSIDWEIVEIKPIRIKDITIVNEVLVKNILP